MKEDKIISGCKKNKVDAQKALVDQFAPLLFTLCKRYLSNDADAYDALQEALISIFKNIGTYQNTGSFKAWMSKIAVNASLKSLRKRGRLNEIGIENESLNNTAPPLILDQMYYEDLLFEIRQLPAIYRAVFNLHVIDGYSHSDIANMLNIQESSSRTRLARAKKILRGKIKKNDWIAIAK